MKKLLTILVAALMIFSLTACNKNNGGNNGKDQPEPTPDTTVMSHADYVAAALDSEVVVETYVQAHQSWWDNKVTVYAASEDGAYFIYNMAATEDEAAKLVPGTKIRVKGFKAEWAGEVEITDATFEILEGSYIAKAVDLTSAFGTDGLIDHQNEYFTAKGLTVVGKGDDNLPFYFSWDNSGSHESNSDLYFDVELNGQVYTLTVESYLMGNDSEVYQAVEMLNVGDVIDVEGFLYWYEGVNPHITVVKPH